MRASLPLAKVNPTPPTLGRCAPRAPGSRGRGAGGGSPGPGRQGWGRGRASAPAASRVPGQVLGDSWAPGRLGRGAGARRRDPGGGGVDPLGRKRRLIRDVFMLICTWLGFSRAEKGCRKEGKKFRRAGNFRKHLIPRLKTVRLYRSPVVWLWGSWLGTSVFSSEKQGTRVAFFPKLIQQRGESQALRLLSEARGEMDCSRDEEEVCVRRKTPGLCRASELQKPGARFQGAEPVSTVAQGST